jgi:ribonuclease P protein component
VTRVGSALDQRFGKEQRLRKRHQYRRVQGAGRKIHLRDLLVFAESNGLERSRVGITVSAKVGGAVTRNRLKRVLREGWRRERAGFPPGYDIVIVAKRSAAQSHHADLVQQLRELRRRLG